MSDRLLVATRKGLFTLERHGNGGWSIGETAFLGDNVTLAVPDRRDGTVYAALDHGHFGVKLHRKPSGGAWEECAVPEYPAPPENQPPEISPFTGKPFPWSLKLIWSIAPGGADKPGRVWCGTVPGGLFRSDDGARSWHMMRSLWDTPDRLQWFGGGLDHPGIHSLCVDPRDSDRIVAGVSCGGVWISTDGGGSFKCQADGMRADYMPPDRMHDPVIQDPHCVAMCAAAPDVMWVQHHNGIFRTTDGGASWHEITAAEPSSFGFAVCVHPKDPDTAWFVPAIKDEKRVPVDGQLVVSRTIDGGRTFEVLRDGLPQQHAYDLVLRHAMDVDDAGQCLAFGSTTGSFWVSDSGGDAWQAVTHHLPPIHAVRFG